MESLSFSPQEKVVSFKLSHQLCTILANVLKETDEKRLHRYVSRALRQHWISRDIFGRNPILSALQTSLLVVQEIGLHRDAVLAVILHSCINEENFDIHEIEHDFGNSVACILDGLQRIRNIYSKTPIVETENFRDLLLSLAEDVRVILIMIADRTNLMRQIRDTNNISDRNKVSEEARNLYAPLAHKLGLYGLKSELEDLSLKYTEHDAYYHIREKLNETKQNRDAYIERFISPIAARLYEVGIKCHIKGRTKSIHSIWQKMQKQKCSFEDVYDLFAIRIIIDAPMEEEKMRCWQTFAIITSMYQPNPKRMRDWLSIPKSNGYESLHITVLGPEQKWVEVQIRTERMDDIAERGIAAHWRYKGVKSETGVDEWLTGIRTMLEACDDTEAINHFHMELYENEIFVFTPKGALYKFPKGATVLDFAYRIHSHIGNTCTGARIGGHVVPIRWILKSGDQVEIITSPTQHPRQDWLNVVKTSHARAKIRLALKEVDVKNRRLAKEILERKFRNHKIEVNDDMMHTLMHKLGIKAFNDFYHKIASGELDVGRILTLYDQLQQERSVGSTDNKPESASNFVLNGMPLSRTRNEDDILIIDSNVKGVDYHLSRCCHPIYGDQVFGFVSVGGGIRIHSVECPNAPELRKRFPYRIIKAKWSGKGSSQYAITLRVVGNDNITIVNNLTSIISKEENMSLRSINIDSYDGLFTGTITIMTLDASRLESLLKKLRTIKGIKQVCRVFQ